MKLVSAHVTNYRNILDSNSVEIGQITCMVGKNEAGKTSFLKALEGLNSTNTSYTEFTKTENYPRRFLADYDERHNGDDAEVISTEWLLEAHEIKLLEQVFGQGILNCDKIKVSKKYEDSTKFFNVQLNNGKIVENLLSMHKVLPDELYRLKSSISGEKLLELAQTLEDPSEGATKLIETLKTFRNTSFSLKAIDILTVRMPKFMYFSHYDRMNGELSVNKLSSDKSNGKVDIGDQVFLDFLEFAGTNLEELTSSSKFEELNAKCEAAALRITDQIFEYWTQNDSLEIQVVLSEGKSNDPPPFNSGNIARARVKNSLHGVTVPFSERSAGFIWFFSFLVKFALIKKNHGDVILLLDEPGLTLHGTAQKDLLRFFSERIIENHQLIYSTHSPFMVPADSLSDVRTVEDVVRTDDRNRKRSEGTKIRSDVLTTDPQTNFPIFGAMGFEITQTLIISPNTLLVEGPSDILYLQTMSNILKKKKKAHLAPEWAICPSGGIDKILPFVRLFYGNNLNVVVLTDFDRGQKKKLDDLYKTELLDKDRVILATEIADKEEADIEDFFDQQLFVDIINKAYDLKAKDLLTVDKLNAAAPNTNRIVKKAEAYFRILPDTYPMFSHFEPALYLLKNPEILASDNSPVQNTLMKFEAAFTKIAKFL